MAPTMKNLVMFYDDAGEFRTALEDAPIPTAADLRPHDVLIKVKVAGSNPKDFMHPHPDYFNNRLNQGDDCAGTIAAVGSAVRDFRVGERVAGFHEMDTPLGTYAEYTVCYSHTIFRIPDHMSDEEAATIPLTAFTAAVGLYRNLDIPAPWDRSDADAPETEKVPLVVNAASGTVGTFAIKFAKMNPRVGPIIAVAGSSADFVKSLGVDAVVDYRSPTIKEDLVKAAGGRPVHHVFDALNTITSVEYLLSVLKGPNGRFTCTKPIKANKVTGTKGEMEDSLKKAGIWGEQIWVGEVHETKKAGSWHFGKVISQLIETSLVDKTLTGHPYEVVERGLLGVEPALKRLKSRKGGNTKFVARIADTPGLSAEPST